jgi:hypothetical protein
MRWPSSTLGSLGRVPADESFQPQRRGRHVYLCCHHRVKTACLPGREEWHLYWGRYRLPTTTHTHTKTKPSTPLDDF